MRVDRDTLLRGAQLVLLLPSISLASLAMMAGVAGVLGGMAGAAGLFDGGGAGNPQPGMLPVYLGYVLICIELMVIPAVGYGLLLLLITMGAPWMAARRWLAILTLAVGADACAVAAWLALNGVTDANAFTMYGLYSVVVNVTLIVPIVIGVFNMALLAAALWRRRRPLAQ